MKLLSRLLSSYCFGGLPIDVLSVENRDGAQIAVVDLREITGQLIPSWSGYYFQGSTGGYATQTTLVETFPQKDYAGDWIDGVEFHYNGAPMTDDWDHVSLHGTKYRWER
jgi:hypothetical protein